jgi:lipoprotein-anchoring transpeptidase ErfK/SrfK
MIRPSNRRLVSAKVAKLQHHNARRGAVSIRRIKTILLGNAWVLGLGLALAATPASARPIFAPFTPAPVKLFYSKHKLRRGELEHAKKEVFAGVPKGPMQAIISIREQRLHFYRDGEHIADVPVATGVPGHLTPLGVFSVIQRDRYHHSNIYSNAPMPFMERITWSGVALHEGPGVGHQASHGCIRMPHNFAAELWGLPTMGMRVIIAGPELRPVDFADPHLFVHKDKPAPIAALTKPVETAQTGNGTKIDAADAAQPAGSPPAQTQAPASSGTSGMGTAAAGTAEPSSAAPAETAKTADPIAAPPASAPANPAEQATSPQPLRGAVGDAVNATAPADITAPIALDDVPLPLVKPERLAKADNGPIAIFISRKLGKIFVRQNFMPLLQAPVTIQNPEEPLGTHVFTALDYLPDHSTLRWNVVSLPGDAALPVVHYKYVRTYYGELRRERVVERGEPAAMPAETPAQALDRIGIPQDVIEQISQLIVPGSSLVVSDHGLGPETGSGTDFIVVTR